MFIDEGHKVSYTKTNISKCVETAIIRRVLGHKPTLRLMAGCCVVSFMRCQLEVGIVSKSQFKYKIPRDETVLRWTPRWDGGNAAEMFYAIETRTNMWILVLETGILSQLLKVTHFLCLQCLLHHKDWQSLQIIVEYGSLVLWYICNTAIYARVKASLVLHSFSKNKYTL